MLQHIRQFARIDDSPIFEKNGKQDRSVFLGLVASLLNRAPIGTIVPDVLGPELRLDGLSDGSPGKGIDPHVVWVSLVQELEMVVLRDAASGVVALLHR